MKRHVILHIEGVPNPNAIKIVLENGMLVDQPYEFTDVIDTASSPLAQKLMMFRYVKRVMLNQNYVTIVKDPQKKLDWEDVLYDLKSIIQQHLADDEPIIYIGSDGNKHKKDDEVVPKMVTDVLNKFVRNAAQEDGGDILFEAYDNGVLTLSMRGACHQCPHIHQTIKDGVEPVLRQFVPEIREVKTV